MKLLIDDIRKLDIVKKGDLKVFVNLSQEINSFQSCFRLMGKESEVEYMNVLQEMESKFRVIRRIGCVRWCKIFVIG